MISQVICEVLKHIDSHADFHLHPEADVIEWGKWFHQAVFDQNVDIDDVLSFDERCSAVTVTVELNSVCEDLLWVAQAFKLRVVKRKVVFQQSVEDIFVKVVHLIVSHEINVSVKVMSVSESDDHWCSHECDDSWIHVTLKIGDSGLHEVEGLHSGLSAWPFV